MKYVIQAISNNKNFVHKKGEFIDFITKKNVENSDVCDFELLIELIKENNNIFFEEERAKCLLKKLQKNIYYDYSLINEEEIKEMQLLREII